MRLRNIILLVFLVVLVFAHETLSQRGGGGTGKSKIMGRITSGVYASRNTGNKTKLNNRDEVLFYVLMFCLFGMIVSCIAGDIFQNRPDE